MSPPRADRHHKFKFSTLNAKKEPVRRFEDQNAIVKAWDGPALQAGESRAVVEQISIAYTAMEIVDV
ncbi:phage tail protein [Streptomyces sp. MI02-7b]|uniref:phage tail protein n=1 Tax=Streptomyces sp. MI02-7b TaxID=462941 RepID=UPI0029AB8D41|nr:phage tail protein [Streptomyces sp. MI02-7b]MDX3073980.1 phage tail protein [Streptomyces sp. MI02-7b]